MAPQCAYVDNRNSFGVTALCLAIAAASSRIVHMLLDAEADETTALAFMCWPGVVRLCTPLDFPTKILTSKKLRGRTCYGGSTAPAGEDPPLAAASGHLSRSVLALAKNVAFIAQAKDRAAVKGPALSGMLIVWRGTLVRMA